MRYTKKLIKSGHVIEILEYELGIRVGESFEKPVGRSQEATDAEKAKNRGTTLGRAKTMVRRLINSNTNQWGELPKFFTLTFKDHITDVKQANYEFKKFRQRLEYDVGRKLKYVVVVEFMKNGRVHYHAIFFNLPYIKAKRLTEIWENGHIWINAIDQVDNVGAYVTKYMTKQEYAELKEDKLTGLKSYFTSRGLNKPIEIVNEKEIDQIAADLSHHKIYESDFHNEYCGNIHYEQYNLKRKK